MRKQSFRCHRPHKRDACMRSARHAFLLLFGLLWVSAACRAAAEAANETVHPVSGDLGPIQEHAPAQGLLQQPEQDAGQHETMAGQAADQAGQADMQPTAAASASSSQEAGADAATASGAAVPPEGAAKSGSTVRRWIQQKLEGLQQTLESVPGLVPEPAVAPGPQDTAAVVPGTAAVTSHQEPAGNDEQVADFHAKQHVQQQQQQQQQVTQQNFQQALATAVQQAEQAAEPPTLAALNVRCMHPCTVLWLAPASFVIAECTQPSETCSTMAPISCAFRVGSYNREMHKCPDAHRRLDPRCGASAR
jgi:hypothetical protein